MNLKKTILIFFICVVTAVAPMIAAADGTDDYNVQAVQANVISDNSVMDDITADSAILLETSTGTIIAEKNANKKINPSHISKLLTVLIAQEQIDQGKLKLSDKVSVSVNANSKGAPQIWLDVGETISVEELIKSITIGNANDGCTALAEKIGGTEQDFVNMMNDKCKQLGMNSTHFSDCTGVNEDNVSTVYDLSLLASEILRYDELTPFFTTWMDNIRNGAVELVSTNRLIRTYKGITGLKSCASKESGESVVASAKRGNMEVCAVLIGSSNDDTKFSEAKKLMDFAFTEYEIYEPEVDKEAVKKIKVKGGELLEAEVKTDNLKNIVIPRGTYSQITSEFEREDIIQAPADKNSVIGKIIFKNGESEILRGEIVVKDEIKKNTFIYSFKRILFNLFS